MTIFYAWIGMTVAEFLVCGVVMILAVFWDKQLFKFWIGATIFYYIASVAYLLYLTFTNL